MTSQEASSEFVEINDFDARLAAYESDKFIIFKASLDELFNEDTSSGGVMLSDFKQCYTRISAESSSDVISGPAMSLISSSNTKPVQTKDFIQVGEKKYIETAEEILLKLQSNLIDFLSEDSNDVDLSCKL
jgi:hypothetical protein